ncbi:MOSC domain-containing protein [Saccharothrix coeruleofusca]|uniref:Molybdenum cofactor sulfurase n=1 Tax=Saccharothrix coeruleofusca TaxID=33919 RepID=A0A918ASE4_9PSEU|nr:MOSC N-terminal beta barrel domain-containing protein [Saccharothrix coeruleofusca]GGP76590.1 molybdenum cofactor sulfurase [Saccharothrix coeruleofusca]
MSSAVVGRVVALHRYPVKSMAGEALERADVSWHGIGGDRRWGFVRDDARGSGFPWLTLRQRPDLVLHRPRLLDPRDADRSPVVVRTPSGDEHDVLSPVLAEALGARPVKLDRGVFDAAPLSLLSTGSAAGVGAPDVLRFRPNVLVEAAGGFAEDAWVGSVLTIGAAVIRVDRPDRRCAVVGVDPVTARRDPGVLRRIAREHGMTLGVYASVVSPGRVAVGDAVVLRADRSAGVAAASG